MVFITVSGEYVNILLANTFLCLAFQKEIATTVVGFAFQCVYKKRRE